MLLSIFARPAFAADAVITCTSTSCSAPSGPLFTAANFAPGSSENSSVTINNNNDADCNLSVNGSSKVDYPLNNYLKLTIFRGVEQKFNGTITELFSTDHALDVIPQGAVYRYDFSVVLPPETGDEAQNISSSFDIALHFECLGPTLNPKTGIVLTEFMPRPKNTSTNEWIEIYNDNIFPVTLEGWKIGSLTASGTEKTKVLNKIEINPKTYYKYDLNGTGFFIDGNTSYGKLYRNDESFTNISDTYTKPAEDISYSRQSDGHWCYTNPSGGFSNDTCLGNATISSQTLSASTVSSPQKSFLSSIFSFLLSFFTPLGKS
ncbi:MAG TPA: hypothetical protein VF828_03530 [Patescibacteria group bacterium]